MSDSYPTGLGPASFERGSQFFPGGRTPEIRKPSPEFLLTGEHEQRKKSFSNSTPIIDEAHNTELSLAITKKRSRADKELNEDAAFVDLKTGLHGVADGLGGYGNAAEASREALQMLPTIHNDKHQNLATLSSDRKALTREIEAFAVSQAEANLQGRGTAEYEEKIDQTIDEMQQLPNEVVLEMLLLRQSIEQLNIDFCNSHAVDGGKTALAVGKTVTLADGRRFEVSALVGDAGVLRIDSQGIQEDIFEGMEHSFEQMVDSVKQLGGIEKIKVNPALRTQFAELVALLPGKVGVDQFLDVLGNVIAQGKTAPTLMYAAIGNPDAKIINPFVKAIELHDGDLVIYQTDGTKDIPKAMDNISDSTLDAKEISDSVHKTSDSLIKQGEPVKDDDQTLMTVYASPQFELLQ